MFKTLTTAILAAGFALAGGMASADVYKCEFKVKKRGWVPAEVYVQYNPATKDVLVVDGIINHFVGEPIAGRLSVDNAKRNTFVWNIKATTDNSGQSANMEYRLTHIKSNNKASITAQALGYIGPYTGRGHCAVTK